MVRFGLGFPGFNCGFFLSSLGDDERSVGVTSSAFASRFVASAGPAWGCTGEPISASSSALGDPSLSPSKTPLLAIVGAGTGTRISLVEPNNTSTAMAPGSTGEKTHAHQLNFSFGVLSLLSLAFAPSGS